MCLLTTTSASGNPPVLPQNCTSNDELREYLEEYKDATFQKLSIVHSKKVETTNSDIKSAVKRDLLWMMIKRKSLWKKRQEKGLLTELGAYLKMVINVPFNGKTKTYDGFNLYKINGVHNHPVNSVIYSQYPRQRKMPKDDPVLNALAQADVNSRKLKEYVTENLGLEVVLRDIYNCKADRKREKRGNRSIEERVESVLPRVYP
jgi:hypothetical protein